MEMKPHPFEKPSSEALTRIFGGPVKKLEISFPVFSPAILQEESSQHKFNHVQINV